LRTCPNAKLNEVNNELIYNKEEIELEKFEANRREIA